MKDIYIKASDLGEEIINEMPKQDLYSLDEVLGAMEEIIYDYHCLKEEYEDYKENVEDTMQPRTHWTAKEVSMYNANN